MEPTEQSAEKTKMLTYFRGNDRGYAALSSLVLILVFSIVFLSLVPYFLKLEDVAQRHRESVLNDIQNKNQEIIETYDLY